MNERKFNFKRMFRDLRKSFLAAKTKDEKEKIQKQMSEIEHQSLLSGYSYNVRDFGEWYNASKLRRKRMIKRKHAMKYHQ